MERARFAPGESAGEPRQRPPPPAGERLLHAPPAHAATRQPVRRHGDVGQQPARRVLGKLERRDLAGELLAPLAPRRNGKVRGPASAGGEQADQHLGVPRRRGRAPERPRLATGRAGVGSPRPQREAGLQPPARDPQVVDGCRPAAGRRRACVLHDRGGLGAQHPCGRAAVHRAAPAARRASRRVTLSHSSPARSSTSRVASSAWKPKSLASPSSSRMRRPW